MAVCVAYRIPHSVFLREWTQADRDKAIWFQVQQADTCQGCGTRPDEWDPERGGDRNAYAASVHTCRGCAVLEQQREAFATAPKGTHGRGAHVVLKRRVKGS